MDCNTTMAKNRSKRYREAAEHVEEGKVHSLEDAMAVLKKFPATKSLGKYGSFTRLLADHIDVLHRTPTRHHNDRLLDLRFLAFDNHLFVRSLFLDKAGAGRNQAAHDDVFFEAAQEVDFTAA